MANWQNWVKLVQIGHFGVKRAVLGFGAVFSAVCLDLSSKNSVFRLFFDGFNKNINKMPTFWLVLESADLVILGSFYVIFRDFLVCFWWLFAIDLGLKFRYKSAHFTFWGTVFGGCFWSCFWRFAITLGLKFMGPKKTPKSPKWHFYKTL